MVEAPISHIVLDERGVAYVHGTRLPVAHVAIDAETWGLSAREILENYPQLTLAQVHAALAYYYDYKSEIDGQIARETETYERVRRRSPNSLSRAQLEVRLAGAADGGLLNDRLSYFSV